MSGPAGHRRTVDRVPALAPRVVRGLLRRRRSRPSTAAPTLELTRTAHPVDRAALAEYQRVCGFDVSSAVPATFVHVQAFGLATMLMTESDFPLPLLGLVHVANRIVQARPLDADEPLELRVWAADLRDHRAGRQVDVCTEARVAGAVVCSEVSTYLHRSRPLGPRDPHEPRPEVEPTRAPTALWRVPRDIGRRYAAVSGDRNPIHLSAPTARAFGFPRAIAHGMWLEARVLAALGPRLPDRFSIDVAFKTPVLLPSTVAFEAERHNTGSWTVALTAARSGRPHLAGVVEPG